MKKEKHCTNIVRRWWRKAKKKEEQLIMAADFQRKAEAMIDNAKNSGQTELDWQIVRRRSKTKDENRHAVDEISLNESDSSASLTSENSEFQLNGRRKRQRTDEMKRDGRHKQEHKNKIPLTRRTKTSKEDKKVWRKRYVWRLGT